MIRGYFFAIVVATLGCSNKGAHDDGARSVVQLVTSVPEVAARFAGAQPVTLRARFGSSAQVPLHVETLDPSFHLDSVAVDDRDVRGERVDAAMVFRNVQPGIDLVHVADAASVEELRVVRDGAPHTFRWKLHLGPAVAAIRIRERRVELLDEHGYVHLAAPPPFAVDAKQERRELQFALESEGKDAVLTTTLDAGMTPPVVVDPLWSSVAPMSTTRLDPALVTLPSGKILAIGGAATTVVEQYDPATNSWSSFGNTGVQRTQGFAATLVTTGALAGKVIIAGASGGSSTVEVFDPATKTTTPKANMGVSRSFFSLTALASGKVLAAGGDSLASSAEVYDPATNAWTASTMTQRRIDARAVVLSTGKVLVAGGGDPSQQNTYSTAELYDPASNTWAATGSMTTARRRYALALVGGKVWVFGGAIDTGKPGVNYPTDVIETFDPASSAWTKVGTMSTTRSSEVLMPLPSGDFAVAGGWAIGGSTPSSTASSELFQVASSTPKLLTSMSVARLNAAAASLGGGRMLVVGGAASSEIFAQAALGAACSLGTDCASGYCVDGVCCAVASCNASMGFSCNTPLKKGTACAKVDGAACGGDGDCDSGHCADGVCCSTTCSGQCESCAVAPSVGTCIAVTGAPAAGHTSCGAGGDTCSAAACNGTDRTACHLPTTSTVCGAASCTLTGSGAIATDASHCDGAGKCLSTSKSCGAYRCNGVVCASTCADDSACFTGYYCDVAAKLCKPLEGLGTKCSTASPCGPKLTCVDGVCCGSATCPSGASCGNLGHEGTCTKNQGTACTDGLECASGFCADGVCCNARCDGQCEACDGASAGTCNPVTGAPHGKRLACDSSTTDVCKNAQCDGNDRTTCAGHSVAECRKASCLDGNVTARAVCDGSGNCPAPIVSSCSGFLCDESGTGCTSSCTSDNQCIEGYTCIAGKCTNRTSTCKDDGITRRDVDGTEQSCAPYVCRAGTCITSCGASADCAPGSVCDETKTCVTPPSDSGGGCAITSTRRSRIDAAIAALVLALFTRSRSRSRSRLR